MGGVLLVPWGDFCAAPSPLLIQLPLFLLFPDNIQLGQDQEARIVPRIS